MSNSPIDWDNRAMFERYLYDYLKKRGMHEAAEIFWREANLTFDPSSRPALDVPDGFLHEWWLTFYDMFKASQSKNPVNNEGSSSYTVEKMAHVGQQGDPSPSREQEMNEQMIRELTASSDFGLTTGGNLMPFMGCHLMKTEQISQGLASSEPQQKSLTLSKGLYHPSNLGNIVAQGVGPSICATLKTEKIEPNESGRKSKNSTCSEDESSGVPGAIDYPSETSSPICKSFSDIVKLSSLHVDDHRDEGKTSSSNSRTNHTTTDTNSSNGIIFLKRICMISIMLGCWNCAISVGKQKCGVALMNYKFHNFPKFFFLLETWNYQLLLLSALFETQVADSSSGATRMKGRPK